MNIKTFLEKLKYGDTEPPPKDYYKILRIIKEKYGRPIPIKFVSNKKTRYAESRIFSSTIYFSKEFWKTLTFEEKLAVIFHEIGHHTLYFRYIRYLLLAISLILFLFGLITKNYAPLLIWFLCFFVLFFFLSHKEEKSADTFAAEKIGKAYMISALKKIKVNKNIPLYKKMIYLFTHPSIEERIKNLEKNS